jgi:hypothetical protein
MKSTFGTYLVDFNYTIYMANGSPLPAFIFQNPNASELYLGQPAIKGTYNIQSKASATDPFLM